MANEDTITVPDLTNLSEPDAETKLTGLGLTVGTVTMCANSALAFGKVSAVNPRAGTSVKRGSPVDLQISGGSAKLIVETAAAGTTIASVAASLPSHKLIETISSAIEQVPIVSRLRQLTSFLFGLLGAVVLGLIVYIVSPWGRPFLQAMAFPEVARGVITFLIAVSTVGIAIILAISTLVLSDEDDKQFDRGKQVLSVLIGVLGTIVGFYYGSQTTPGSTREQQTLEHVPLGIVSTGLPGAIVGTPYTANLGAIGGTAPFTWSVSPPLPAGLRLDSTSGAITGTPTAAGTTNLQFTAKDSATPPNSETKQLTLIIRPPPQEGH
jgi:PASTA domain/Putative Ig domain